MRKNFVIWRLSKDLAPDAKTLPSGELCGLHLRRFRNPSKKTRSKFENSKNAQVCELYPNPRSVISSFKIFWEYRNLWFGFEFSFRSFFFQWCINSKISKLEKIINFFESSEQTGSNLFILSVLRFLPLIFGDVRWWAPNNQRCQRFCVNWKSSEKDFDRKNLKKIFSRQAVGSWRLWREFNSRLFLVKFF